MFWISVAEDGAMSYGKCN